MKLFIVTDKDRWGHSVNLVRAKDREAAMRLACPASTHFDVEELQVNTSDVPQILWTHDESPDSYPEGD